MRGANVKLISTDKDTARDLRRLITASDAGGPSSSSVSTITSPVIAKVVSAISAGDHTQKTARLMTISGGAIVATGQTVQIRNVGSGAVAANTVVLTEPCGKLGQCFTRNANLLTPVNVTWSRSQHLVSPLNSDSTVSGYDRPWTFGNPYTLETLNSSPTIQLWQLAQTPDLTPTEGTVSNPRWVIKMRPIRYRIGDGGWTDPLSKATRQYLSWPSRETAFRSFSPPATGHHSGALITQIIVQPPIATVFTSAQSAVTHVRVLKNGVDLSGVVSVSGPADWNDGTAFRRQYCRAVTIPISPSEATDSDVFEVDYWFRLSVTRNEGWYFVTAGNNGLPVAIVGAGRTSRDARQNVREWRAIFTGINVQAKQYVGDVYKLTFDANGPGGATTLNLQAQADWSFMQTSATSVLMTKTSGTGTGEWVSLNWGKEIPEVRVKKNATPYSGTNSIVRFLPANTGTYQQIDGSSTPGSWDPLSATTFSVIGINGIDINSISSGFFDASVFPAAAFTPFPASVTVEKV